MKTKIRSIKGWAIRGYENSWLCNKDGSAMIYFRKKDAEFFNSGMDEDIVEVLITPIEK